MLTVNSTNKAAVLRSIQFRFFKVSNLFLLDFAVFPSVNAYPPPAYRFLIPLYGKPPRSLKQTGHCEDFIYQYFKILWVNLSQSCENAFGKKLLKWSNIFPNNLSSACFFDMKSSEEFGNIWSTDPVSPAFVNCRLKHFIYLHYI